MKNMIFIFLLIICSKGNSQVNFQFDYLTVYESKSNEIDTNKTIHYFYASSKNEDILACVTKFSNGKIFAQIINEVNIYNFDVSKIKDLEDSSLTSIFKNCLVYKSATENLKKIWFDKYIVYFGDENNNSIIIEVFKNKKKKKKQGEIHYLLENHDFIKNQFYSSPVNNLSFFDCSNLKTEKIIKESYIIDWKTKEKINIYKLLSSTKFDLEIKIPELSQISKEKIKQN